MSSRMFLSGAVLFAAACGGNEIKPAPVTPAKVVETRTPTASAPRTVAGGIAVDDDLLKVCGIHLANPEKAPKFDLDSADVQPEERDVLQQIATCLTTGPLKGRSLRLTGRADPRGEVNYNMALGAVRAKNVAFYLTRLGIEPARMKETSRGELDSTGTDEGGWQKDRRVDITLQ